MASVCMLRYTLYIIILLLLLFESMASNNNIMCWALFEIYSLYKLILTIGPYEISTITFILRCEN